MKAVIIIALVVVTVIVFGMAVYIVFFINSVVIDFVVGIAIFVRVCVEAVSVLRVLVFIDDVVAVIVRTV